MSMFMFKILGMTPLFGSLLLILKKFKEAEDDLVMQRISFQEFGLIKEVTINFGAFVFILCALICLL